MTDEATALTVPQQRYLREIVEAGERNYNGRARRVLDRLEAAGLIEYESDLHLHARGDTSWTLTARPTDAGREHVRSAS
jgi:DNA-binding MarR family transcriptional regulator